MLDFLKVPFGVECVVVWSDVSALHLAGPECRKPTVVLSEWSRLRSETSAFLCYKTTFTKKLKSSKCVFF